MDNTLTRKKILNAAMGRFGHYGFSKTTMTEIARDCEMSAANIYRHFGGKNDILEALASRIFAHQKTRLTKIVSTQDTCCSLRLHNFIHEALTITHQYVTLQPKMREMVDFICQERLDLIETQRHTKEELVATLLKEGMARNEFTISDVSQTAKVFINATVMFHTPLFMDIFDIEELEAAATPLVDLFLLAITTPEKD